ncbi:MAG: AAA family ATPase [Myxococcota bacterium]
MWRRVSVKNFRSLKEVHVDLAPFTVVVGPNGSGKSSLADVLVFGSEISRDAATAIQRRGGIVGLRRWSPSKPHDVSVEIRAAKTRKGLDGTSMRHQFTLHSGRGGSWSFSREQLDFGDLQLGRDKNKFTGRPWFAEEPHQIVGDDQSLLTTVRRFREARPLTSVKRVRPNPDLMRTPRIADEVIELTEAGDNVAAAYMSLGDGKRDLVERTMAQIIPGLRRIAVVPFDRFLLLRFEQEQHGGHTATFSATEMSDGALRALAIMTALAQMTRDQLLVIEEPEVSVHAGAANLLFDALKAATEVGSVLVTTHSADLLDAAKDEEILVCRYADGVTRVGPLATEQRQIVRDGLFSLAELVRSEPLRIEGDEPTPVEL